MSAPRPALAGLLALALQVAPAAAEPWPICDQGRPASACVVDGDTIWWHGDKFRFAATDAPETEHARCPAERASGERTRDRLAALLGTGATVRPTGARDRYDRRLAGVTVPAGDVEAILLSEGLTLPYAPGRAAHAARAAHWCGG